MPNTHNTTSNQPTSQRWLRTYQSIACHSFNIIIALIFFNIFLYVLFRLQESTPSGRALSFNTYRTKYSDIDAYTDISPETANRYLDEQDEMGRIGVVYRPWVQFGNPHYQGTLLTTNNFGFRTTPNTLAEVSENQKIIKVAVFGGSTTFGYGVPNEFTIPAQLQSALNQNQQKYYYQVFNYGQGFYYSSQELILFLNLVKANYQFDYAIFIDGANDTAQLSKKADAPWYTSKAVRLWRSAALNEQFSFIPMIRFAKEIYASIKPVALDPFSGPYVTENLEKKDSDFVISRYLENQRIIKTICEEKGIIPLFIWQPVPFFKYNRTLHRTFPYEGEIPSFWADVYSFMEQQQYSDFLYLGDLLEKVHEKIFVDDVHYNEKYNRLIAHSIAQSLRHQSEISSQ